MILDSKKLSMFCKKSFITFFTLILFFLTGSSISAETTYDLTTSNKEVGKYIMAANKANNATERIQNYMLAANAVKKEPLTKDNATILAWINYVIGKDSFNMMNLKVAIKAFEKSYYYLKLKKINKNNEIAFLDLLHLSTIAQMCNEEKAVTNYLQELANTQKSFEKSDPCEFKSIYDSLSNAYTKDNNLTKAKYYKEKALIMCKPPTSKQKMKK